MTWDVVRILNVILSMGVVIAMTMGATARWNSMPKRFQRITPWVVLTYAVIAYGSAEVAHQKDVASPGIRVVLMMLNLIGLLIALLWRITAEDYDDKPRKGVSSD